MPVYTYRCENCGVQFDRTQKFSDDPLKRCPECGKSTLHKVYTPVGIIFKGSGFYATDHRSPSGTARTTTGEKSSDKPAETKPSSTESSPSSSSTASVKNDKD
jgi:putative FmdB family regulatory protein